MSDRSQQPAALKRRIAVLEGQLKVERERSDKAFEGYRTALYELVEIKLRLDAVVLAANGESA